MHRYRRAHLLRFYQRLHPRSSVAQKRFRWIPLHPSGCSQLQHVQPLPAHPQVHGTTCCSSRASDCAATTRASRTSPARAISSFDDPPQQQQHLVASLLRSSTCPCAMLTTPFLRISKLSTQAYCLHSAPMSSGEDVAGKPSSSTSTGKQEHVTEKTVHAQTGSCARASARR